MSASWSEARKILAVRLDGVADVLLTTPAIRALKQSQPGRNLTLLASRSGARAAAHIPEVDAAIGYDAPWSRHPAPAPSSADLAMRSLLESRRFDAAVIFAAASESALPAALLCHLAGIRLRLAHCRENPHRLLTHWVPEPANRERHEARRQLDLVAAVGAHAIDERLSFRVSAEDRLKASMRLAGAGVDVERPWIAVHPGAQAPSHPCDPRRLGHAAARLSDILRCQVAVTGDERGLGEAVRERAGPHAFSVAGMLRLNELGAVVSMAPFLVSNDAAAVHLAAAVGTPVVDLCAPANPQRTPWLVPHRVLDKDAGVEDIVAAALALWPAFEPRYMRAA